MIETEIKAFIGIAGTAHRAKTVSSLGAMGFRLDHFCEEEDRYYQAPDRDFRKTDEALRIRIHSENGESRALVTYKGPKMDSESHMRHEVEVEIADSEAAAELFDGLGYKSVFTVSKHREVYKRADISVCLDDVKNLGFAVEIEKLIPEDARKEEKQGAREELLSVLDELGISRERLTMETYLEMLLKKL